MSANLTRSNRWIHLSSQHTSVFGYYVLWLHRRPLHPFIDLSKPLRDNGLQSLVNFIGSDIEEVNTTPKYNLVDSPTTMSVLSNATFDHAPYLPPPARCLLHAYVLGRQLGVPHFQDAVMNTICMTFAPTTPSTPAFVKDIYERSDSELSGLKKLCVDYYIFQHSAADSRVSRPSETAVPATQNPDVENEIDHGSHGDAVPRLTQVPPLKEYAPAFFRDVTRTLSDIRTALPASPKSATPYDRVRREYRDVRVDFDNLGLWLRDGDEGRQKCRFHQHDEGGLCLNRIT